MAHGTCAPPAPKTIDVRMKAVPAQRHAWLAHLQDGLVSAVAKVNIVQLQVVAL